MDWNKGYSARYYISVIDKKTRRDLNRLEITEGSISRKSDGLRESADLTCVNYYAEGEQLIRVWLDTTQDNGDASHTPLFTGLATSPGRDINGRLVTNRLECYSVLKYAQDILLPRGWYAPAGANAGTLIRSLLSVTGSEITVAPDITTLENAIIAESGEKNHINFTTGNDGKLGFSIAGVNPGKYTFNCTFNGTSDYNTCNLAKELTIEA